MVLLAIGVVVGTPVYSQGQNEKPAEVKQQEVTVNDDSIVEIDFTNEGLQFLPANVSVPVGSEVHVTYTSSGRHDWVLEGYDVGTEVLQDGESATIVFTADKTGEFEFYCSVMNHRERGMYGLLTVN